MVDPSTNHYRVFLYISEQHFYLFHSDVFLLKTSQTKSFEKMNVLLSAIFKFCTTNQLFKHYGSQKYLTMVDCGLSPFAIWRIIRSKSETEVVSVLRQVFSQFGPPAEILCDNGRSFTSILMRDFCEFWAVRPTFRCAYKPSGNGIMERNHGTIKRMPARSGPSVEYSVFWYNASAQCDQRIILT